MSIKKFFEKQRQDSRNYADYADEKSTFEDVESQHNAKALVESKNIYVPQVDYSEPQNFVKFGSAYMYYSGALNRIVDYYPYDGSKAERNEFYNKLFDVEKYIFDNLYPRFNGFANFSAGGASFVSKSADGYGGPTTGYEEHIAFKGGPGTVTSTLLVDNLSNDYSSKHQNANIYDTSIYTTAGLPSDYAKGTRTSNLKSNFDTGVTVEFWLKKDAFDSGTDKEVILDIWNNQSAADDTYGRLSIELNRTASASPFRITVRSGSTAPSQACIHSEIGQNLTTTSLQEWSHYAFRFFNSGSHFVSKLYVNGKINDTNFYGPIAATAEIEISDSTAVSDGESFTLVTAAGVSIRYTIDTSRAPASGGSSPFDPTDVTVGFNDGGDIASGGADGKISAANAIATAINNTTDVTGTATFIASSDGVDTVTVVQVTKGASGNKTNIDGITGVTVGNFTGGDDSISNIGEITTSEMLGRIGALVTSPEGSVAAAGAGTLSGALDDFRFWKVDRDSRQIAINYFDTVGGGVNTDISNAELGVYYKFNEGITQTASVDSIVLDYAGRVTNGVWTGYAANSRNTGSAIVLAGAATKEYRDPVVRINNPHYTSLRENLLATGSWYDGNNNASFVNYSPGWVLDLHDEDENLNLKIINHIAGAYFDKLYLMAADLPKFKHATYTSASFDPIPFASHLPTSMGLYVPDLFVDADILERMADRTETELFENKLAEIKNLIYQNLYNNVTNIYKSKGTLKAIRNVFRCFNIDDELLRLKIYNKNATFEVKDNLQQQVIAKKAINFNTQANIGAVVYQKSSSLGYSSGYISGSSGDTRLSTPSPELYNGMTAEASFIFPNFFSTKDKFDRVFEEVSLFGMHTVNVSSSDSLSGVDTTFLANDPANLQVFAVRDAPRSSNVYFKLSSSVHPFPIADMTSSVFLDAYDDSKWNISVRIKPKDYPNAGRVAGSLFNTYDVIFRGVNTELGVVKNYFEVSSSITNQSGSDFVSAPKRIYVGARRENITGNVLQNSDVLALDTRYWAKFIDNDSIDLHSNGYENNTVKHSYRNLNPIDAALASQTDIKNYDALALSWNFNNVTSSDGTGNFRVLDYSSGSAVDSAEGNYGWLGPIAGVQHDGYGHGFSTNSTTVVSEERINAFVPAEPETAAASDMIQILSDDDQVLNVFEVVPSYVYTIEKSLFESVSKEMLNFFGSAVDFNNVIGDPVNRYRSRYKELEKLRETFYRRVTKTTDVENYIEYYKWFDDSIATIVSQLVPASSDFIPDVLNTVESHVLERHKYETKFPTLESNAPDIESGIETYSLTDTYSTAFSPVPQSPRDTTKNRLFWKLRANRSADEITSGDATIDTQRETFRRIISSNPFLSRSVSTQFDFRNNSTYNVNDSFKRRRYIKNFAEKINTTRTYKGGVNFTDKKNIQFVYSSLHPAGPVNKEGGTYVPLNVLLAFMSDLVKIQTNNDPKLVTEKTKRYFKVLRGRDYEEGLGYYNLKSSMAFPFNIYTGSISDGYQSLVNHNLSGSELIITNLHNDVYGPDMEKPMQGPFTEYAVGGHQSRHVKLNEGSDSSTNRPEAWKILLGTCDGIPSGAIGMAGPDYPDPATPLIGEEAYPYTLHEKAVYYRDMTAKRPVNIRNIQMKTGSTILGNYRNTYDYVQAPGAFANPRHFVDNQPDLPDRMFVNNATSSMISRTILDIHRTSDGHTENVEDYNTEYLDGNINKSVIISRFNAVGGIEVQSRGYQDIRAGEFSVYNSLNNRYLTVIKPTQGPSGTISTAATSGDTTNIQVFDIHGKDYGLYSHLARHTARFGRDSLFESAPGTSYTELPGFHKVHRNNFDRRSVEYCFETRTLPGETLTNTASLFWTRSNLAAVVDNVMYPGVLGAEDARAERSFDAEWAEQYGTNKSVTYTFSAWVKFPRTTDNPAGRPNTYQTIFNFGGTPNGTETPLWRRLQELKIHPIDRKARYRLANHDPSDATQRFVTTFEQSNDTLPVIADNEWHHIAFTFSGSHGFLSNQGISAFLYVDGVQTNIGTLATPNKDHFHTSSAFANFRNATNLFPKPITFFGDINVTGSGVVLAHEFSGFADEIAIYKKQLSSDEVQSLYNGGAPCILTSSNAVATGSLLSWFRCGDLPSDNTDLNGSTAAFDSANARITEIPGTNVAENVEFAYLTARDGELLMVGTSSVNYLTGCTPGTYLFEHPCAYPRDDVYDNFNVQHQIPRMSKQYAWITGSLVSDNDWPGFTPANYEVKKKHLGLEDNGYTTPYSFVSASDFGTFLKGSTRRFGTTIAQTNKQFIPTDFVGLNTNIVENINSTTNTIGESEATESVNLTFNDSITTAGDKSIASAFNSILLNRGGAFGYPSWQQMRNSYNPILRNERKNNKFTNVSDLDNETLVQYNLPPVSNRAKPNMVNFSVAGSPTPYTFLVTDENERIYFNSTEADNQFAPPLENFVTPGEQMMVLGRSGDNTLNWVVYSQQIFPSIKNEFVSSSTNKVGYDNLYWKDSVSERYRVGTVFDAGAANVGVTPGGFLTPTGSFSSENSFGLFVSQSSWPLDPPQDFLTRRGIFTQTGSTPADLLFNNETLRFTTGAAGELQNCYMGMETVGAAGSTTGTATTSFRVSEVFLGQGVVPGQISLTANHGIGSLYARKQTLKHPTSVRSPYGPDISVSAEGAGACLSGSHSAIILTGSMLDSKRYIEIGAGEAMWQAPSQAGIIKIITETSENGKQTLEPIFVSASSSPWWNDYESFRYDLKLKAKGFSIVPEYRISENMDDLLKSDGKVADGFGFGLEIPHVSGANARTDQKFYTTYTNSEFLKDFLRIRDTSLLKGSEIRISCTGAIRLNPYKGFYPAQRTLDLATEFKNSFKNNLAVNLPGGFLAAYTANILPGTGSFETLQPGYINSISLSSSLPFNQSYALKPLINKLFSPGILYNSIKSGIAVDYPNILDNKKISRTDFNQPTSTNFDNITGSYALDIEHGLWHSASSTAAARNLNTPWQFFDDRLPFETMVEPEKYLIGKSFFDLEANPLMSLYSATASFVANESGPSYKKIARNFFGSVPSFFLKDGDFSTIKSALNTSDFKFKGDEVYMMRIKLNRSSTGPRTYDFEIDSIGDSTKTVSLYTKNGGVSIKNVNGSGEVLSQFNPAFFTGSGEGEFSYYGLPQDPRFNPSFKETFTMYSRPTAFGPPICGRPSGSSAVTGQPAAYSTASLDSFSGFNPAFTPPYYNGEAWCDLIFRPSASISYTLRDIMAETKAIYWRFDAGPIMAIATGSTGYTRTFSRALIAGSSSIADGGAPNVFPKEYSRHPYGGSMINDSSMQLSASFNLFGLETEVFEERDKFGILQTTRPGTTVGDRWVIKSKFETPMLNFSDVPGVTPRPISQASGTVDLPLYGSASVPHGMWHQFGTIPTSNEGVYISVEDIPSQWLNNHYLVKDYKSIYNNNNPQEKYANNVSSLADLVGFNTQTQTKLGVLKDKTTIREAIVAIPYIIEQPNRQVSDADQAENATRKSFIEIPRQRYEAARVEAFGSELGDSLDSAGPSISKQLQKMNRYIFPPQLDFLNNPEGAVDPFVMYIFEFKYEFDKDDLSYIWQNLAPRDYKKMEMQYQSVAHELMDTELLNETVLRENQSLRWMVFKVKQKGQEDYWDYVVNQVDKNTTTPKPLTTDRSQYKFSYNWPYDYVSFVEMIKMSADIKFEQDPMGEIRQTSLKTSLLQRAAPTKTILTAEQAISGPRMTAASALTPTATTTANNIRAASVATSGMTLQAAAVAPTTSTTTATTVRGASTTPTMRTTVTDRGPGSSGGGSGY